MYILFLRKGGISMTGALQRWGNSNAIRIPKKIVNLMNLNENDPLELTVVDGVLTVKKIEGTKPQTLTQLYEMFYGMNKEEILKSNLIENTEEEVDWGKPVGQEEW